MFFPELEILELLFCGYSKKLQQRQLMEPPIHFPITTCCAQDAGACARCVAVGVHTGQSHQFITGPTSSLAPTNNFRVTATSLDCTEKPEWQQKTNTGTQVGASYPQPFVPMRDQLPRCQLVAAELWMSSCWGQMTFCLFVSQK